MNTINLALQILPSGLEKDKAYAAVDAAIKIIAYSGLKYNVCPFETVIEGNYADVMKTVEAAQEAAFNAGVENMMVYIKMQCSKNNDVLIEEKMEKYS